MKAEIVKVGRIVGNRVIGWHFRFKKPLGVGHQTRRGLICGGYTMAELRAIVRRSR